MAALEDIAIADAVLTADDVAGLCKQLSSCASLTLSNVNADFASWISIISSPAPALESLVIVGGHGYFSHDEEFFNHIAAAVRSWPRLEVLTLRRTRMTATGLEMLLGGLAGSGVLALDVSCNLLGPDGGHLLGSALASGRLQALGLEATGLHCEGALALIRACTTRSTSLQALNVRSCGIDDEGVAALCQGLPASSLQNVFMWGNPGLQLRPGGRPGLEALAVLQLDQGEEAVRDARAYRVDGVAHAAEV
jgi:hypothetical protein